MTRKLKYRTEEELFWAGKFGDRYINRNSYRQIMVPPINLFSRILSRTSDVNSVIEFGANIGINLDAIKILLPKAKLFAVEINTKAANILKKKRIAKVFNQSMLDFSAEDQKDFVLIKGVLIHTNPNELNKIYKILYEATNKYICIAEYYNPTPVEIEYHSFRNRLYKRDFAGEILKQFSDLKLLDYGFTYHKDDHYPEHDDLNWFLLEKRK